ncbi:type II secretion system protein [Thioalkalivibrio sp. HK1]|uniref:type II secretion system protein n=1 Tax=Thioalkalivibrio sp. HK1 TaxID=1469245 RepID=UPI000471E30A|nr:type II secretion system protein [Thioalkalivibrio sp. HK1]
MSIEFPFRARSASPRPRSQALAFKRVAGLTLLEMLVVLIMVSLVGTILVQAFGNYLNGYSVIRRVHRDAATIGLGQHWFMSTVQSMVPSMDAEKRGFSGGTTEFQGLTLQPLASPPGTPAIARWEIRNDGSPPYLAYSEYRPGAVEGDDGRIDWVIDVGDEGGALSFQYADEPDQWHTLWRAEAFSRVRIPRMVRLVSQSGHTVWLARLAHHPEPMSDKREVP